MDDLVPFKLVQYSEISLDIFESDASARNISSELMNLRFETSEESRFYYHLKQLCVKYFDLNKHINLKPLDKFTKKNVQLLKTSTNWIDFEVVCSNQPTLCLVLAGVGIQLATGYIPTTSTSLDVTFSESAASLVLDHGSIIYHWNEPESSRLVGAKAMEIAAGLRKSRSNRPKVLFVEDVGEITRLKAKLANVASKRSFNDLLLVKIYKISIDKPVEMVFYGIKPSKTILNSSYCYLIETRYEVYGWNGKQSTRQVKNYCEYCALVLANSKSKDSIVAVMEESMENVVFKDKFVDFGGFLPISMSLPQEKGNIASVIQETFDLNKLLAPTTTTVVCSTKTSTKVQFFLVRDFKRYDIENFDGFFYQNHSYCIVEQYVDTIERCNVYYWQGSKSSISDKGTSALMTIEITDLFQGETSQFRVVQGKETSFFISLFPDQTMVVRQSNDVITGITTNTQLLSNTTSNHGLKTMVTAFDCRQVANTVRVFEIDILDAIMTEFNCLLVSIDKNYLWKGKFVTDLLFEKSKSVAKMLKIPNLHVLTSPLDQLEYCPSLTNNPRLFSVSSATGVVEIVEIIPFSQDDLVQVAVLDTGDRWFIWIGENAKLKEKLTAIQVFDNRKAMVTFEKREPGEFKAAFHGWSCVKFSTPLVQDPKIVLESLCVTTYSAQVLLSGSLPENVDPTRIEDYLSEQEFELIFKMKRSDYSMLKPWKKQDCKRRVGFY